MTEREEMLEQMVDAMRRYAREELVPAEDEVETTEEIPDRIVRQLKEFGLFGMTVPEEYGGLGLSVYEEVRMVFEITYASPVFRSYFGTTNGVGTLGLVNEGTDEQRQRYLPRIASGEMMASFCLSEPDAGSDVASLTTKAVRDGDHRVHMAAVAAGLCVRLIDEGLKYAEERVQFGRPIANFQMIQAMLAESQAEAYAARAMIEKAARDKDAGKDITMESACCKYFATEAVGRIADRMLQIHGGNGYIKEYPIERLYRDVRLLRIYEGTSQVQQLIVAREMRKRRGG